MSPLVKTKRQTNFKDFKRFGAFKGFVEQKNVVFNSCVCQLGFFGTRGPLKHSFYLRFQKNPIYTRTRQMNYHTHYKGHSRPKKKNFGFCPRFYYFVDASIIFCSF
jgi:hypothetical protein